MKFTNLGGATGILEFKGKRMLFDPWLDDGIFHGAWFHYPPVKLPQDGIKGLGKFDYVYISHIHEDHCSLGTLRELNVDAELIIMDRTPNFVLQFVKKNGLKFKKIHLVPAWEKVNIDETLTVAMMTTDPAHELNYQIDSAIVLEADGCVVYNSNDCIPYSEAFKFLNENYKKIDLALIPYATGSSYPSCFDNLSHEEKMKEKERLFHVGIKKFREAARELSIASVVMPFADQYIIAGKKSFLNKYMPHPSSPGILRDYYQSTNEQKLLLLNSLQSYDLKKQLKIPDETYVDFSEDHKDNYAKDLAHVLYDYEKFELSKSVNISNIMQSAAQSYFIRLEKIKMKTKTKFIVEVSDWGKKYIIDNDQYTMVEVDISTLDEEPLLKVTVEAACLVMLLIGHISWNIADAALFINYNRRPNVYDPAVHALWNYLRI